MRRVAGEGVYEVGKVMWTAEGASQMQTAVIELTASAEDESLRTPPDM